MADQKEFKGRCIVEGCVEGEAIVTDEGLSFMGSVNPKTGYVIERKHQIEGECLKGKILFYPTGKGSTGGSYMLYDLVKNGCGPKAIVCQRGEAVAVIGAIVADLPMMDGIDTKQFKTGDHVRVDCTNGVITKID